MQVTSLLAEKDQLLGRCDELQSLLKDLRLRYGQHLSHFSTSLMSFLEEILEKYVNYKSESLIYIYYICYAIYISLCALKCVSRKMQHCRDMIIFTMFFFEFPGQCNYF